MCIRDRPYPCALVRVAYASARPSLYDVKSPVRFCMRRFHSRALITKKIQFKSQVSRSSSSQMAPWRNWALYLRGWPFTRVTERRKVSVWSSTLTRGVCKTFLTTKHVKFEIRIGGGCRSWLGGRSQSNGDFIARNFRNVPISAYYEPGP